ncbi:MULTISPECIES: type II toxin-antitoxin system VapC family toxin [unclassified Caballeronia]|jgi:PIN domain nuclease of toxin-antitoxin system|uniref:type II toxin-antitoxin system VapC family toxin n=1 Tax=unclassified Caballeronia TaxID=2646786 RepID=UPI0028639BFE|nr:MULTISPECIES: type II toxin-antitoxin system VapC family toxin [unclassified Caballeronia]MDR5774978.1 type II toxin-antitoxin system VapC family toxin [Caballeronia sp. LZ002]MDR5801267.1 type II toxin-antitoxin system VapC family toxin [Caballeronia sp. LZ001]MDR5850414.1 type II toxin-antitoxin system VapC family toxin [Caballeronia sp. LZ003]
MIVLDTHTLLWWVSGAALGKQARAAIEQELEEGGEIVISTMTAWEIAMLVKRGRVVLSADVGDWLDKVSRIEGVRFVPVDRNIAVKSADLPGEFHKDPADRMIVATARSLSAPLVTKDRRIRDYQHVKTIW